MRIISVVLVSMLFFTACGQQPGTGSNYDKNTSSNNEEGELRIPTISPEEVSSDLPDDFPETLPFSEGITVENVYNDKKTNNGDLVYYVTEKTVKETYHDLKTKLSENTWAITKDKQHNDGLAYINFQKDGLLCSVYITSIIPKMYSEVITKTGTFVQVKYNLPPPQADNMD